MATANFISEVWGDILRTDGQKVTLAEHWASEYSRQKRAEGFELVDLPSEWIAAREAFWEKFQALIEEGEDKNFIRWVTDEGYEKTYQTKHWVKKGKK